MKITRLTYAAIPALIALLFAAAGVAAAVDELRYWMSPLVIVLPISLAVVLLSCTLLAWSSANMLYWATACAAVFIYISSSLYFIFNQRSDTLYQHSGLVLSDIMGLVIVSVLLGVSVACIRALSRTAAEA